MDNEKHQYQNDNVCLCLAQPNNLKDDQHCTETRHDWNNMWNDHYCYELNNFVCKHTLSGKIMPSSKI